jgi:hypothetical protein
MNLPFSKKGEDIVYFRAETFCLFSFFGLSKIDAALLVSVMEKVDTEFTQVINISTFASVYCIEYRETFMFLWEKCQVGKEVEKIDASARGGVDFEAMMGENEKNLDESVKESLKQSEKPSRSQSVKSAEEFVPYHVALAFLMFFLSIPDADLFKLIFWAYYRLVDNIPDHKNLIELIDQLWPSSESEKFRKNKCKLLAKAMIKKADKDDFFPNKFNYFDIRSGAAWTRPVKYLKKMLISNTLGSGFWQRMAKKVWITGQGLDQFYNILRDRPMPPSPHFRQYIFILRAYRRDARKFIRQYVRLLKSYYTMQLDVDTVDLKAELDRDISRSSFTDNSEAARSLLMRTILKPLKLFWPSRRQKRSVYQSMKKNLSNSADQSKSNRFSPLVSNVFGGLSEKTTGAMSEKVDINKLIVDAIPLEIVFKESLTVPVSSLLERSMSAQQSAIKMLQRCEISLQEIEPTQHDDEYGGVVMKRASRKVVVDVDDDGDDDDSNDDGGEDGDEADEDGDYAEEEGSFRGGGFSKSQSMRSAMSDSMRSAVTEEDDDDAYTQQADEEESR